MNMPGWVKQARFYLPEQSNEFARILSETVFAGILTSLTAGIYCPGQLVYKSCFD
jgi:hypothetical protein